jgi:pimeloyl-ACP methyl ester carboxylesterase
MASYTARGLTLRYEQAGDGRPVILLHGMSNHCLAWAPQLDALAAAGWRAVLPDLAGHGRSDPVTERTTTEDLAGDVVALLDVLEVAAAPVCGLSLGGMVTQQLLVDHPERVTGALVVSAGTNLTFPAAEQVIASWKAIWLAPGVRVPVLAVAGQHDRLAPPQMVEQVAASVPGGRLEVVEDAQHLVNLERPDRFNELLLGLLAQA